MAHALKTIVRQVAPVIQGPVLDVRYEAATQKFFYLVSYELNGDAQERWFEADQVEVVGEQA